jgi:hypothetical protein
LNDYYPRDRLAAIAQASANQFSFKQVDFADDEALEAAL